MPVNVVAFCVGCSELVNRWRASSVIYLDLSKAFDTVLHDILFSKLNRHGFDRWIRNWQDVPTLGVSVNSSVFSCRTEQHYLTSLLGILTVGQSSLSPISWMTPITVVQVTLEGTNSIQKDTDGCERWVCMNAMQFSKAKWQVLHPGQGNPKTQIQAGWRINWE